MWDAEGRFYGKGDPNKPLLSKEDQKRGVIIEGRKFRDVAFAVLFVAVFLVMTSFNVIGFMKGNPSLLLPSNEYDVYNVTESAEYWFHDSVVHLKRDVDVLGMALAVSFILGLVWLQLMRMFTKLFIYLTAVIGILGVAAGGIVSLQFGMTGNNDSLKIFSYCLFGVAFILVIALFFLRSKINLTAALFTECSRGVQHNPGLLLVATVIFVLFASFIAYWVCGFLFLFSITDTSVQVIPNSIPQLDTKVQFLIYFNLFGFYWTTGLLSAIFQTVIAGAISSWYFSRDGSQETLKSPSLTSLRYALTKSLGSLALGSLLVAIVEFVEFLVNIVKKSPGNNKVLQFAARIVSCFLSCIQALIRWINRYAYISIAMRGDNFISSAKSTFDLISRNSFSTVVVDTLGTFVLFIGKLLGISVTTIFALIFLHYTDRPIAAITIIAVVIVSFFVFSLLANIVSVGVDTIMVCYLEELESGAKDHCVDPTVHQLLQDKVREANRLSVQ